MRRGIVFVVVGCVIAGCGGGGAVAHTSSGGSHRAGGRAVLTPLAIPLNTTIARPAGHGRRYPTPAHYPLITASGTLRGVQILRPPAVRFTRYRDLDDSELDYEFSVQLGTPVPNPGTTWIRIAGRTGASTIGTKGDVTYLVPNCFGSEIDVGQLPGVRIGGPIQVTITDAVDGKARGRVTIITKLAKRSKHENSAHVPGCS